MKIDGRCHCGYISYEAEIDPEKIVICHCTDCQILSGSAFRTVALTGENTFKLLSGEPKVYVKTTESGAKRQQSFCPECGTPIYSSTVGYGPKVYGVRVGTARQRDELVPKTQLWFRSSQRWLADLGSVRKIETQPAFDRRGGMS
ncbi:MAG TPA: GFA family protein [Xanthobacteraceae bacterium]|nr:GFA family protein [Xanthobacteraceae bacterium]